MQAGKLDRRIQFQSGVSVPNSIGEYIPSWVTVLSMWASIDFTDTRERFEASELVAPSELTFTTRYESSITEKMRIVYAGQSYDILHIAELNRRAGLKIIAKKKDNSETVVPSAGIVSITSVITGYPDNTQEFVITISGTDTVVSKHISQQHPVYLVDLPFGTYTLTQVTVPGYTPVSIVPATVVLSSGNSFESVVVTNEITLTT